MGCRRSSVDSSAHSILPPGFEFQVHHLCFYELKFEFKLWRVEKTKINRKRGMDWPIFTKEGPNSVFERKTTMPVFDGPSPVSFPLS